MVVNAPQLDQDWEQRRRALRHELRTHLNHILSYAELLHYDADAAGEVEFAEQLKSVQEAGQEGLTTIGRMLDTLSTDSDAVPAYVETVEHLMESVQETAARLQASDYASDDDQVASDLKRIANSAQQLVAAVQTVASAG